MSLIDIQKAADVPELAHDTFEKIYLGSEDTYITYNETGDLVFHDIHNGDVTLTEIKNILDIYWTYGKAFGVWAGNLAGEKKRTGITEDADGLTYFNDEDEIE